MHLNIAFQNIVHFSYLMNRIWLNGRINISLLIDNSCSFCFTNGERWTSFVPSDSVICLVDYKHNYIGNRKLPLLRICSTKKYLHIGHVSYATCIKYIPKLTNKKTKWKNKATSLDDGSANTFIKYTLMTVMEFSAIYITDTIFLIARSMALDIVTDSHR